MRSQALAFSTAAFISGGLVGGFVATTIVPAIMTQLNLRYELARDSLLLGTSFLLVQALMIVAFVLRIADSALEQSLYNQSLDRVILQVDEAQAPSVRPVFHGLAPRLGRGLGAICVLILTFGIGVTFQQMSAFFLAILLLWILSAFSLRPYLRSI